MSTSNLPAGLYYALVPDSYIDDAYQLEVQGYPADEAASLDALRYRQSHAPSLFLGAFLPPPSPPSSATPPKPALIAFITSTLTPSPLVTHHSMSVHTPSPPGSTHTIALHSLCVAPAYQRRGVASALLAEYVRRAREGLLPGGAGAGTVQRIALLTHAALRPLYERAGFTWVGESAVQHGADKWYDMILDVDVRPSVPTIPVPIPIPMAVADPPALELQPSPPEPQLTQADVIAALLRERQRPPAPESRTYASFSSGDGLADAEGKNAFRLRCLRPGCGSLILLEGVGALRASGEESFYDLDTGRDGPPGPCPPLARAHPWWLVTPSPMAFENVAFSRTVPTEGGERGRKLLGCAECELGPIGWYWEGQGVGEFWVAVDRVGYR